MKMISRNYLLNCTVNVTSLELNTKKINLCKIDLIKKKSTVLRKFIYFRSKLVKTDLTFISDIYTGFPLANIFSRIFSFSFQDS